MKKKSEKKFVSAIRFHIFYCFQKRLTFQHFGLTILTEYILRTLHTAKSCAHCTPRIHARAHCTPRIYAHPSFQYINVRYHNDASIASEIFD